jgi:putative oxidoreductase
MIQHIIDQSTSILAVLFLFITFFISVIEKFADLKGTFTYMTAIFEKTLFASVTKILIWVLICLEIVTLFFLSIGLFELIFEQTKENAIFGSILSTLTILSMLLGQRVAKDYVGATSLTVYFLASITAIFLLQYK